MTFVVATHDPAVAERVETLWRMDHGSIDHSAKQRRRMIVLYWLRSLIRVAPGRTLATAAGIALAVAFAATLAIFVISASYTMTARAVANVPVDWQVDPQAESTGARWRQRWTRPAIERVAGDRSSTPRSTASLRPPAIREPVTGPGRRSASRGISRLFPGSTLLSGSLDVDRFCQPTAADTYMRAWAMRSASIGPVLRRWRCEWPASRRSRMSTRSFRRLACLPALRRNRRPTTS